MSNVVLDNMGDVCVCCEFGSVRSNQLNKDIKFQNVLFWIIFLACVAGGSGCARETFCGEAANSLGYAREGIFASGEVNSTPFFSRPARLFALAVGTEVRAGTHSRRLRRL